MILEPTSTIIATDEVFEARVGVPPPGIYGTCTVYCSALCNTCYLCSRNRGGIVYTGLVCTVPIDYSPTLYSINTIAGVTTSISIVGFCRWLAGRPRLICWVRKLRSSVCGKGGYINGGFRKPSRGPTKFMLGQTDLSTTTRSMLTLGQVLAVETPGAIANCGYSTYGVCKTVHLKPTGKFIVHVDRRMYFLL